MNNKKSALPVQYLTEFQFSINHGRSPAARALCTYTIYAIRNSNLSARANVYGLDILVANVLIPCHSRASEIARIRTGNPLSGLHCNLRRRI
jgi:hypothetical protein